MWKFTFYYGVLDIEKGQLSCPGLQIVTVVFVFFLKLLFLNRFENHLALRDL